MKKLIPISFAVGTALSALTLSAQTQSDFKGVINKTSTNSTPDWPKNPQAPAGAPNIVLILLDDVGFGATGTFGGAVSTPNLDQLASQGLKYNRFHVTGLCSPTRAALLSGRNHHRAGFGTVVEGATGYPGYNGTWRKDTSSLAEVLRRNGYNTAAFGKWHNTPAHEVGPAGPFDHWPTSLGFEYFYGFQFGEQTQYETVLYRNTLPVDQPKTVKQGYHFTTDIVDDSIKWLHTHEAAAPNKPFFLYLAPGATHAPLHVQPEWIVKYKGKFDQGWDKLREETFTRQKQLGVIPADAELTPRPKELPAWDSLTSDQKRIYAHQAEVYAAFLEQTDYEVGRLLKEVQAGPHADNTLILYIVGDNGASAEGGLEGGADFSSFLGLPTKSVPEQLRDYDKLGNAEIDNHYNSAWAWATNTPFQWTKQVASHLGGIRDPLVVSWPARIKEHGALRDQFLHVNDVTPTIYELAGITPPETVDGVKQLPFDGTSFAETLTNPKAVSHHKQQYFEMVGNRGIYKDGWFAGARHSLPWNFLNRNDNYDADTWELYNLDEDYSQAKNLADKYPEKLAELKELFEKEAKANNVYPLAGLPSSKDLFGLGQRPSPIAGAKEIVYHSDVERIPNAAAPLLLGNHRIKARVTVPAKGAEGVLIAQGERQGGFSLYIKDGHLVYENNFYNRIHETIRSEEPVPTGEVELVYEYTKADAKPFGGGTGRLFINGKKVAEAPLKRVGTPSYFGTLGIGRQNGGSLSAAYEAPFAYTGTLDTVTVTLLP